MEDVESSDQKLSGGMGEPRFCELGISLDYIFKVKNQLSESEWRLPKSRAQNWISGRLDTKGERVVGGRKEVI